ncbi:PTS system beta-glucoside-specific IIA component, Glc family /PTS system beta-glucoside-specific IIB component, Glc family /PTS system beta-glucoside-specific IIC component, Glc family [Paenibacillus sp. CF095]|uniref:beta-glucoside-specific PTS transporter subunit IIABC n=1 Tax=Paenibacillus sp. CF095 TaxID=1881033 RepID=UPI00087F64DB|nr:beta-glucoside-specific PTS transporter subunit IIABC [Paenibacillus sp. CF095]SDC45845.1 PTS system beta-glucoside-specific IIA component, Glc family /PTS system beta-glucoside-specific IIB component, Glc family /PTS system beta-glucoside-specific IIC component, Glc family [Paenibacillus sp. CF095]
MSNYDQLAKDILSRVGGRENVNSVFHCVTRLRFKLKNESVAKTEELKNLPGVITVMQSGGQYQVVIGNEVPDVYKAVVKAGNFPTEGQFEEEADNSGKKVGLFSRFIDMISGVFTPLLGLLAATGMIKGFTAMFLSFGWITETSGTYQLLNATGDCLFYFFPIFLGYTAIKKFGGSPFLGMAIGASLVYPSLSGLTAGDPLYTLFAGTLIESPIHITFLGIPVILMSYSTSVIPIIIATFFAVKIERFFKNIIPKVVSTFLVPFFTLLVIVPATFILIGPVSTWAGQLIGAGATGIYDLSPVVTGLLIGGLWQVFVLFGLHWGLVPVMLLNLSTSGADPVIAMSFAASFAQIGAVLAVILKTKNTKLKSLGIPAFISGIFGVTEPAIYGLTLPLKKPFIMSCIAGGIGGGILGLAGSKLYIFGGLGVFGFPSFINKATGVDSGFYMALVACGIAFVLGFILTYVVGFKDKVEAAPAPAPVLDPNPNSRYEIVSPMAGEVVALNEINDITFAGEHMGKGIAIRPISGRVVSPITGVVQTVYRTKHAIGLVSDDGVEMLIHIGQDTVKLKGQHFTTHVKDGDRVNAGDLIVEFDLQAIKDAGYETVTPIIVTNTSSYLDVVGTKEATVHEKDKLITVLS